MTSLPPLFSSCFDRVPQYKASFKDGIFFFTTNEKGSGETIRLLAHLPPRGNTMIGVSGTFSLDLLAARMSAPSGIHSIRNFIVVDKSPLVKLFWESLSLIMTGNLEESPPHRLDVLVKINALIRRHQKAFFAATHSKLPPYTAAAIEWDKFKGKIKDETSFASSDEKFKLVQSIFREGHFKFLQMDMADSDSFVALGEALKAHDLHPDTIYVSNIEEWVKDIGHHDDFNRSLSAIKKVDSIVVDSERPKSETPGLYHKLIQRVIIPN